MWLQHISQQWANAAKLSNGPVWGIFVPISQLDPKKWKNRALVEKYLKDGEWKTVHTDAVAKALMAYRFSNLYTMEINTVVLLYLLSVFTLSSTKWQPEAVFYTAMPLGATKHHQFYGDTWCSEHKCLAGCNLWGMIMLVLLSCFTAYLAQSTNKHMAHRMEWFQLGLPVQKVNAVILCFWHFVFHMTYIMVDKLGIALIAKYISDITRHVRHVLLFWWIGGSGIRWA